MKKLLLFASVIALMTSCAKTNITGDAPQAPAAVKGIYFAPSVVDEAPASKADLEQVPGKDVFNTNWFSDKDRIGVIFDNGGAISTVSGIATAVTNWFAKTNATTPAEGNPFEFKASVSGVAGHFVAANDEDVLLATAAKKTIIRAYWPYDLVVNATTQKVQDLVPANGTKITLPDLAAQAQTTVDGLGIVKESFMIAETTLDATKADISNDNSITAKRLDLPFKRINPIVWFKITADKVVDNSIAVDYVYDRDYVVANRFGNLQTVKLSSEGAVKADGTNGTLTTKSPLTYGSDATFNIAYTPADVDANNVLTIGTTGVATAITNTLGGSTGLAWNNDATVFMSVANVDRAAFRAKGELELMSTAVAFEKLHFDYKVPTKNDWSVKVLNEDQKAYNWIKHQEIDLDAMPYIVYQYTPETGSVPAAGSGYVLQINPSFKDVDDVMTIDEIFSKETGKTDQVLGFTTNGTTAIKMSEIKHIVAKTALSNTDLAFINTKLTNLEYVTLLENTSIPAKAFNKLTAVKYWNLPKVNAVANVDAFASTTITDLYMGSFNFNLAENKPFRALTQKANLVRADVSATPEISTDYPLLGLNFQGFTELLEIRVAAGVKLGVNAFKGCTKLHTVNFHQGVMGGAVVLAGNNVFQDCDALTTIAVSNKDIPAFSFKGCNVLATIKPAEGTKGGIVPEAIRQEAFMDCAKIVDMDLSKAAIIEAGAFSGCTSLVGNMDIPSGDKRPTLSVDAITVLNDEVFAGCTALDFVSFAKVTKIGIGCFAGNLDEIRFFQPVTGVMGLTAVNSDLFGNGQSLDVTTKLFVNKDQKGIVGNTLTLKGDAEGSKDRPTTFNNGIQVNPVL